MKQLEKKLATKFLFPKISWLEALVAKGVTQEPQAIQALCNEDLRIIIDQSKLKKFDFNYDLKVSILDRPLAVQILEATNVGVPKKSHDEDEEGVEEETKEEEKLESRYLDPSIMKEKKKVNLDS